MDTDQVLMQVQRDLGEIKGLLVASLKIQEKQDERIDEIDARVAKVETWQARATGKYTVVSAAVAAVFTGAIAWIFKA